MNKNHLSLIIPAASVLVFLSALFLVKPTTTGLVIYLPNESTRTLDADITFQTKEEEIMPPDAIIEVSINDRRASLSIREFIEKTESEYRLDKGGSDFGFFGSGFSGDYTYNLSLSQFPLNREVQTGPQILKTQIKWRDKILYEKESRVMVG